MDRDGESVDADGQFVAVGEHGGDGRFPVEVGAIQRTGIGQEEPALLVVDSGVVAGDGRDLGGRFGTSGVLRWAVLSLRLFQ